MNDLKERAYTSDSEAYDIFVGGFDPREFATGYDSIKDAVEDFLENYESIDGEKIPSWLPDALIRYIDKNMQDD